MSRTSARRPLHGGRPGHGLAPSAAWPARLAALLLAALLAGCGILGAGPPAQAEQSELDILVQASPGLNRDEQGRPAPILMRVYELRGHQVFQEADFFALYNTDRAALGTDVLAVDQLILRPGEAYRLQRRTHPEARVIAVLAGYRDLPRATWRAVHFLPAAPEVRWYRGLLPRQRVSLLVDLQPLAVLLTDRLLAQAGTRPNDPRASRAPQGNTPAPPTGTPGTVITPVTPPPAAANTNPAAGATGATGAGAPTPPVPTTPGPVYPGTRGVLADKPLADILDNLKGGALPLPGR